MTARYVALLMVLLFSACLVDSIPSPESVTVTSVNLDLNSTESTKASTADLENKPGEDVSQQPSTSLPNSEASSEANKAEEDEQIPDSTPLMEHFSSEFSVNITKSNVTDEDLKLWQHVVHSSNQFALQMYKVLKSEDTPLLISPLSIGMVLGMLWLGSSGKTAMQIAQALQLPENRSDVIHGFHELFQSLQKDEKHNISLDIASKLYADSKFVLNEDFYNTITKSFLADAELLNFVTHPDLARISINQWVEDHTQSRIKELLQEGVISADTKVVMVNAVYFKGFWINQFMKDFTREMPFHLMNGSIASTPTMLAIGDFPTANIQHLNCTVLKVPYEGSVSLMVFLPRSQQGLPTLEENLLLQDIEEVIPKLENVELHLYFPKFKLEFSTELENSFHKLGIDDVFQTKADLSGISPIKGLSVTNVLHKTFLEITEEGSEASAASAAVLDIRGGSLSINVDHPFLFVIRDDKTGAILFLGNYRGPE
ncbi:leukocyte elastase inhibitor-like [Anabrus simplex]|uniref:leukocyte elastase inhibitor-like n=1 Tax=Anabrus simplex TaxID=316456 RepID=UPI0035A267CB